MKKIFRDREPRRMIITYKQEDGSIRRIINLSRYIERIKKHYKVTVTEYCGKYPCKYSIKPKSGKGIPVVERERKFVEYDVELY